MNILHNALHSVFGLFLVRNVDSILGELGTTLTRLEKAVQQHDARGFKLTEKARKLHGESAMAHTEADRAQRVAEKIRALVD
jgi:hypothetical protein